jgi:hypothetical protein
MFLYYLFWAPHIHYLGFLGPPCICREAQDTNLARLLPALYTFTSSAHFVAVSEYRRLPTRGLT